MPFDLADELHLKFDAVAVAYRRAMRAQQLGSLDAGGLKRRPPTKKSANRFAMVCELAGPSGLYQRGIQLTAPNSANASSFGSPLAKAPLAIPSSITRRTPLSNASRRAMTALQVRRRQRLEIQKQCRPVQFVEDGVHKRVDETAQLDVGAGAAAFDLLEQLGEAVERVLVAGEENLFLVLEVVVEIPLLHVQRRGDLFNRGAVIPEPAERLRRALQDVDAGGRPGSALRGRFRRRAPGDTPEGRG